MGLLPNQHSKRSLKFQFCSLNPLREYFAISSTWDENAIDLKHILFVKLKKISQKRFGKKDEPMRSHLATHATYNFHTRHNFIYKDRTGQNKWNLGWQKIWLWLAFNAYALLCWGKAYCKINMQYICTYWNLLLFVIKLCTRSTISLFFVTDNSLSP